MPELHGRISSVEWRDDFTGETRARIAPVGENPRRISYPIRGLFAHGFVEGETVTLSGEWDTNADDGRVFLVNAVERNPPTTREGEIIFLAGYIKGLSKKKARKLIEHFGGLDALAEAARRRPQELEKVLPRARKVRARLRNAKWDREELDIDMFVALQSAGLRTTQIQELVRHFGADGLRRVAQNNPYEFCQVPKVGFTSAENVAKFYAKAQGRSVDPYHDDRLLYGIRDVVGREQGYGHVCAPEDRIIEQARRYLDLPNSATTKSRLREALTEAIKRRLVVKDHEMIYPRGLHHAEKELALLLSKLMMSGAHAMPKSRKALLHELDGTGLSDEQKGAVATMATEPVSLLVGGPGRGKTWTLRAFIDLLESHRRSYAVLAPTGKAAKRAQEVTGTPCHTIHKACGLHYEDNVHSKRYGGNVRRQDRLREDVVIVDESSMIDLSLGFELVRRIKPSRTSLVFVGDPDQLPPVGAGQVLRDLLEADEIPTSRLTTVFRQDGDSAIVDGADAINEGRLPIFDEEGHEVRFFDPAAASNHPGAARPQRARDFEAQCIKRWVTQAVQRYADDLGIDPIRDIHIYAPQKSGPLGLHELNTTLQKLLNPPRNATNQNTLKIEGGFAVREGDKVMQIRNNYRMRLASVDPATKKKERKFKRASDAPEIEERVSVMNGQVGYVTRLDAQNSEIEVRFEDLDQTVLYLKSREWRQLAPAYAISIHRSQGSETPYAFIVLHDYMHPNLMTRPLIYTAWTRAQKGVAVFSTRSALKRAIENVESTFRYSNLHKRLAESGHRSSGDKILLYTG